MIVDKSTMLHILIRSIILNGWSLLLTAALTVVIVYLFIVIGFVCFREDFVGSGALPLPLRPPLRCAHAHPSGAGAPPLPPSRGGGVGGLPQPKAELKSGGKPPPPSPVAMAPFLSDGEGPFCKVAVRCLS